MPKEIKLYRLFIAAPSDIENERQIIRDVVTDWNVQHGQNKNVNIEVVSWRTHSYPSYGERPQDLINQQVFDSSDIIVGVFWTKFGTPTGVADSGTEEEIKRGIEKGKKVMVYFSEKPINPKEISVKEYQKVEAFKGEYENEGIYFTYEDEENYRKLFRKHLAAVMDDILEDNGSDESSNEPKKSKDPEISITLSSKYWTLVLAGLDPLVTSSMERLEELKLEGINPEDLSDVQRTVLAGPLITRGIIIEELAKEGVVNQDAQKKYGIETIKQKAKEFDISDL